MEAQEGKVDNLVGILNEDKERDFANAIAITSRQRKGKSRLAHMIATKTYANFSYEHNYLGNPKHGETFDKLEKSEPRSTNWLDEAEKVLSAERYMTHDQWELQQLFNQDASNNRISLLCTPDFLRIDPRWRRTHITIWIYIIQRGLAVVMKNRDLQSSMDTWGLKAMGEYEIPLKASDLTSEKRLQVFTKNPSFLFYFNFPDWDTEEQKAEYTKYKQISQMDLSKEIAENRRRRQSSNVFFAKAQAGLGRIISHLNVNLDVSYLELAKITGYSQEAVRELALNFEEAVLENPTSKKDIPQFYFNDEYVAKISEMRNGVKKL